jgi:two-component system chemotaxis sensor kinase CheA
MPWIVSTATWLRLNPTRKTPPDWTALFARCTPSKAVRGSAGYLQFHQLGSLAHDGENILAEVRKGAATLTPEAVNRLLEIVDAIRKITGNIAASGNEVGSSYEGPTVDQERHGPPSRNEPAQAPSGVVGHPSRAPVKHPPEQKTPAPPAAKAPVRIDRPKGPRPVDVGVRKPAAVFSTSEPKQASTAESGSSTFTAESIRVNVQLLDQLMNLVGELVLTRNQITQFSQHQGHAGFAGYSQRLNLITTQLQEGITKTRLQQIGALWQRFPRLVRDLARQAGKEVNLEIEGAGTELDKTLLEALADPMLHLVRNAIDHGIEKPELRRAKGKPDKGRLHLRAYHQGGQVHIEIQDDGAGLNTDKIREKAVERGLFTMEESVLLTEEQIQESIFLLGFSTANQVSDLSGRGVGLDVVKTCIEQIGGLVDVRSSPDHGTIAHIKVPLTLAIVPALIVMSGGQPFAVPQANLSELLSLPRAAAEHDIERVHQSPVYRLRGRLLPLVPLRQLLRQDAASVTSNENVQIVVVRVGDEKFAVVVDEIAKAEEIVVKRLGSALRGVPVYAGATILGDGTVALILDVLGLARRAGVFKEMRRPAAADSLPPQRRIVQESVLVCEVGADRRIGIPLGQLLRIERLPRAQIETSFDQDVLQCREDLLALVHVHRHLRHQPRASRSESLSLVICRYGDGQVGLVVDQVLEIAEAPADMLAAEGEAVVAGAAVLLGRVTDILDLAALLRVANPVLYRSSTRSQLLQTRTT